MSELTTSIYLEEYGNEPGLLPITASIGLHAHPLKPIALKLSKRMDGEIPEGLNWEI